MPTFIPARGRTLHVAGVCINRIGKVPGTDRKGVTVDFDWSRGDTFSLRAPILDFTIQDLLDNGFHARAEQVLKHWIDYDLVNLSRIRNGMPTMFVPHDYETNSTNFAAWVAQGGPFREDSLRRAQNRLKELLSHLQRHHSRKGDLVNETWCAMVLRQFFPDYERPSGPDDLGDLHDGVFHSKLNRLFGMVSPPYLFAACDTLLDVVRGELSRHGISAVSEAPPQQAQGTALGGDKP